MSILRKVGGMAAKTLVVDEVSNYGYRGNSMDEASMWFFGPNGVNWKFSYAGHSSAVKAYTNCPPVASIINKKAQAHINGKLKVVNTQGKDSTVDAAKKIQKLFSQPNTLQSGKQFEAQTKIYVQLFGFAIVLPIKPFGFPNIDASALWNIPPFMVDIKETKELFYQQGAKVLQSIVLNYKGIKTTLNVEDLMIIKDFTPSFDSVVIPDSRIRSLSLPINNIIGSLESRNVLINYRGALGILSPENGPLGETVITPMDKAQLQSDFQRYGLKNGQWQVIISNASLKWQPMGYPTKELMLFEEVESDTMMICDAYGYPYRLLSQEKSASYNDVNEFKKMLYHDTIIPEADSDYEQWNALFHTAEYNITMLKDFSHIHVMQDDILAASTARRHRDTGIQMEFLSDAISIDEWRKLNNLPPRPDGKGDKFYSDVKDSIGQPSIRQGQETGNPEPEPDPNKK